MDTLVAIINQLKAGEQTSNACYFIPEVWNYFGYQDYQRDPARPGEIKVCPYRFFRSCLEGELLKSTNKTPNVQKLSAPDNEGSLLDQIIYGMLPRFFTAWPHDSSSRIYPGTLLKTMALLPLLKDLGVSIVYLLPPFETSYKYPKGEIGSPYAIKNHYGLDWNLHDPLLGETISIEDEFKAFVTACHLLGIKVMVDFVFRTVARDHDLISEHPEWFYWIETQHNKDFSTLAVGKDGKFMPVNAKTIKRLYQAEGIQEHLQKFTFPPSVIDPQRWDEVKAQHRRTGENILTLIEDAFQITTVPGFSNMLNDPQPPWFDVTYLKLYFDLHPEARSQLGNRRGSSPDPSFHGYAPFILQDGACANLYRGKEVNQGLWDYISGTIPFYQKKYGIDGARIDMGHALPPELLQTMLDEIKKVNPAFLLWSEEFNYRNAPVLKDHGFHMISGSLWSFYKNLASKDFMPTVLAQTLRSALPVTAAPELPDTPRLAYYSPDQRRIELIVFLNYLLPNAVPFLNNGVELMERQPMNLGLDNTEEGRFVLPVDDPIYGKLAFFDNCYLHWRSKDYVWMSTLLHNAKLIRSRYAKLIKEKAYFLKGYAKRKSDHLLRFGYYAAREKYGFVLLANKELQQEVVIDCRRELPRPFRAAPEIQLVYAAGARQDQKWPLNKTFRLAPGETIIVQTREKEGSNG